MLFFRLSLAMVGAASIAILALASTAPPKNEVIPSSLKSNKTLMQRFLGQSFVLKDFEISGIRSLAPSSIDDAIAPFLNTAITETDLPYISKTIADAYEQQGFDRPLVMIPLHKVTKNHLFIEIADAAPRYNNKTFRFGQTTEKTFEKQNINFQKARNINLLELEGITQIQEKHIKNVAQKSIKQTVSLLDTQKLMYDIQRVYQDRRLYPPRIQIKLDQQGSDKMAFQVLEYEQRQL